MGNMWFAYYLSAGMYQSSEQREVDIFAKSRFVISDKVGLMSYREVFYVWKDNRVYCKMSVDNNQKRD
jgi:hypothetical protein